MPEHFPSQEVNKISPHPPSHKKKIQHTDALLQSVWQNMEGVNNGTLLGKIIVCAW